MLKTSKGRELKKRLYAASNENIITKAFNNSEPKN